MAESTRTRLVVLGSGTPNPDPERMGPAAAVVVDDAAYLVDFGPGVVRRAEAARRNGIPALRISNLTTAFLTHLHSDHTAGYADLIYSPWVMGRDRPLTVYGPPGLGHMTEHLLAAYAMDHRQRVCGLEPINPDGYGAIAHEVEPGEVYRDDRVTVTAFAVDHGDEWQAYGYRFDTADGAIVISGDTRPTRALLEACSDCDILLHEVYSAAGFAARPAHWQRYHAHMHTSTRELAEIAKHVRPGLLVLTHQLFWGVSDEELVREVTRDYAGRVVCAADLDVYVLPIS